MSEPLWQAWVEAHHSIGCEERLKPAAVCRYRAAHIRTAKLFADILFAKGYRLVPVRDDAETVPMFGDVKEKVS